ncbi:hypothetical protein ACP70R_033401 [Stipagrostis hirtigluma subsp. patula]
MASPAHSETRHLIDRVLGNLHSVQDIDPSTATDLELLRCLRGRYELAKTDPELFRPWVSDSLARVKPGTLPRCFVRTRPKDSSSWGTWWGDWKVKEGTFTAIREDGPSLYGGAKRTLVFHSDKGDDVSMQGWRMHEYYLIHEHQNHDLYLETRTDLGQSRSMRSRCSDGKSEVWQHFTKIHTEDPDVVYAACHCCDRMFKAHSKKDGTNHLKRHSEACRHKRHIHEEHERYLQEMEERKPGLCVFNADLDRIDPKNLPPCFIMGQTNQPSLDTQSVLWKEKKRAVIAIRRRHHQVDTDPPSYCAVKKTLEFHQRWPDGSSTKTDWLMNKYFELHPCSGRPDDFIIREETVMCLVFQKDKDGQPSVFKDLKRLLDLEEEEYKGELCPELEDELNKYMTSFGDCLLEEGASSDQVPPAKRPRHGASHGKSGVWHHFSKIFNKDHVLLYGVCHSCRKMLKALVKNGTTSLIRHNEKCSPKRQELCVQ